MNEFAKALSWDRELLGLTQAELAAAINISQQAIARWEGGQSSPRKAAWDRLIKFMDIECSKKGKESLTVKAPLPLPGLLTERLTDFIEKQEEQDGPKASPERIAATAKFLESIQKYKEGYAQQLKEEVEQKTTDILSSDAWYHAKELNAIPELRYLATQQFGEDISQEIVSQWILKTEEETVRQWINNSRETLITYYRDKKETMHHLYYDRLSYPDRLRKELTENLHAAFHQNIDVMVQRGINSRRYDYFSKNVVAEFKILHPHRPPSFNINQYAPNVVSLMLAKTMSFGQDKVYYLLIMHHDISEHDVMSVRMQSLQLDCSSLGIHALLVKDMKQAAAAIRLSEESAETSSNLRNSIRKS
jgi:transcriptional regulator with XRE-family HTH domain